jgi:membrane peptidoglycan carboxypeptidase
MPVQLDDERATEREEPSRREPSRTEDVAEEVAAWLIGFVELAARLVVRLRSSWAVRWPSLRQRMARGGRVFIDDASLAAAEAGRVLRTVAVDTGRWWRHHWPAIRRQLAVGAHRVSTARRTLFTAARRALFSTTRRVRRFTQAHPRPLGTDARRFRPRMATTRLRRAPLLRLAFTSIGAAAATAVCLVAVIDSGVTLTRHAGALASWSPQPANLPPLAQRSVVYAADGRVIAVLHASENRQSVKLEQVAPVLVNAVIDTEDARFWQHGGSDPRAIARAALSDVAAGQARQGASTIAQQLAKSNMSGAPRNLAQKVKELVLADRLERRYGKLGVLQRYLNTVYFGEGAYGVEAAAETYFGVAASQVNPAQAALLAGMIQDPDGYDPVRHADAAATRRQEVLTALVNHGHLDARQATAASNSPLPTQIHRWPDGRDYFTDAVVQELLADPQLGTTQAARYHAVFAGGLQIHTTVDPSLQAAAQASVANGIPQGAMPLSAALAAVDPGDGSVRAVVGGPGFSSAQYNAALAGAGRQPGSAFKVFTLVAAFEQGYSPNDVIDGSSPCNIPNPHGSPDPWSPSNFEGEAFGPLPLSEATARSVNCAYARLAAMVGAGRIAQVAHDMGVTAPLKAVPSITLGTNDVPPLQMASAYATLAADGVAHTAHLVSEIDSQSGKTLFKFDGQPRRVMSSQVAREVTQVLQQVVTSGTGTAAAVPGHPVAGKTGTAENYQDAWFVGFSPQVATAVWMGDPKGEVPMIGVGGINVVGGSYPARLWGAFMQRALSALPPAGFPGPDPSQVPPSATLVLGQPRGASPSQSPSSHSEVTTWCWSSCGH